MKSLSAAEGALVVQNQNTGFLAKPFVIISLLICTDN